MLIVETVEDLLHLAGRELGTSDWIPVTQEEVNRFADVTRDHQWIHVDERRASSTPVGGTIAHGMLTLSLVPPRIGELVRVEQMSHGLNYGFDRVRFLSPVKVGCDVRVSATVISTQAVEGGVRVVFRAHVEVKDQDRPACVADSVILFLA